MDFPHFDSNYYKVSSRGLSLVLSSILTQTGRLHTWRFLLQNRSLLDYQCYINTNLFSGHLVLDLCWGFQATCIAICIKQISTNRWTFRRRAYLERLKKTSFITDASNALIGETSQLILLAAPTLRSGYSR